MAVIALIQNQFSTLNSKAPDHLSGFERQLYDRFFEILVEESGHEIQRAPTLNDYQEAGFEGKADVVICAPFSDSGNLAPGFAELARIQQAFEGVPVIVWSTRDEEVVRVTVLEDHHAAVYYTGTLLDAGDDFADMILDLA